MKGKGGREGRGGGGGGVVADWPTDSRNRKLPCYKSRLKKYCAVLCCAMLCSAEIATASDYSIRSTHWYFGLQSRKKNVCAKRNFHAQPIILRIRRPHAWFLCNIKKDLNLFVCFFFLSFMWSRCDYSSQYIYVLWSLLPIRWWFHMSQWNKLIPYL